MFPQSQSPQVDADYFASLLGNRELEIRYIDSKVGRGLFTKKAYKAGDVILTEPPVASVLALGRYYSL